MMFFLISLFVCLKPAVSSVLAMFNCHSATACLSPYIYFLSFTTFQLNRRMYSFFFYSSLVGNFTHAPLTANSIEYALILAWIATRRLDKADRVVLQNFLTYDVLFCWFLRQVLYLSLDPAVLFRFITKQI